MCWMLSKDWNGRIASITGYKLCANWKGACRAAWSYAAKAIFIRLHVIRKVQKEGRRVSHKLSKDNKNRRRDTALTLLSKFRKKDFLHKIVTDNEKWILYDNLKRKKSWINPGQFSTAMPSPISMARRFCSASGIGKVCCITSCYSQVKQSRQTATNKNWSIWTIQ